MKIGVVGDCHGKLPDIDEGDFEDVDLIIATGDFCGGGDELRSLMFESIDEDWEWYDKMENDEAREKVEGSLEKGRGVLEYLDSFGVPVFVVPGNWDWSGELHPDWGYLSTNRFQEMVDEFENIHNVNFSRESLEGFDLIGYGPCSGPEIPQYEDDKPETEEELEEIKSDYRDTKEQISKLFEDAEDPVIFLSHNVPHNTSLDKIDNEDSPAHGRHYGSIVVRDMIEGFGPVLSIAGHMHEGYGKEDLEGTPCLNAGLNAYGVINLDNAGVEFANFNPEFN